MGQQPQMRPLRAVVTPDAPPVRVYPPSEAPLRFLLPYFDAATDVIRGLTVGSTGPEDTWAAKGSELLAAGLPLFPLAKLARGGLDLSRAARLKRAAEQGFDVERTLYHGTTNTFPEFQSGRAIYLADDPAIAGAEYAMNEGRHRALRIRNAGPNVMPVYAKGKRLVVSDLGPDGTHGWSSDNLAAALGVDNPGTGKFLHEEAKRRGFDVIEIRDMTDLGGPQTQVLALRPNAVRSVFAKFDPRNIGSADLLASLGGTVALSSLARPRPETR